VIFSRDQFRKQTGRFNKKNPKNIKSTTKFHLNKCINRKFSALLIKKHFFENFKPGFKNTYSCRRIDRALRMREKIGTGLEVWLHISGWR
jgi:hypothetical protein